MAWFRTKKSTVSPEELEERLEKIDRELKNIRLEWDDAYDRLTRIVQRITKRAEVVERAAAAETPDSGPVGSGIQSVSGLSARALDAQERILALRAKLRRAG